MERVRTRCICVVCDDLTMPKYQLHTKSQFLTSKRTDKKFSLNFSLFPILISHRDGFFNQLKQLQSFLLNLQSQRTNLQKLEANRNSLSKQAALITEAEALGSALSSHTLNTLTQRYNVYKRTRNEYSNCKQALLDQSAVCTKQMLAYQNYLDSVRENKIAEYQLELSEVLCALEAQTATQEFDALKEFLDNSAQTAIYIQSCQMSTELHVTMLQQIQLVQRSLEMLRDYGEVVRYHPPSVHMAHRIAKYSDWCRFLSEHQSVLDCRDVVTQFQMSVGKNAINKIPLQQVVTFSYQLEANIRDGQFKLQKTLERYSVEVGGTAAGDDMEAVLRQYEGLYDNARTAIRRFRQDNANVLHLAVINVLCDLNNRLLLMENAAASSGDNLIDLTFNGNWFLDEIYMHASIMVEMVEFSAGVCDEMIIKAMHAVKTIYGHLREINATFSSKIFGEAIYGIIGEDQSVLNMISTVSSLQDGRQSIPELLTNMNLHLRRSARIASGGNLSPSITSHQITVQACTDVKDLRRELSEMVAQIEQIDEPNAGQKLFLELNGMFDKLEMEHGRLLDGVDDLVVPENWKEIKQIKDSSSLAVSCCRIRNL